MKDSIWDVVQGVLAIVCGALIPHYVFQFGRIVTDAPLVRAAVIVSAALSVGFMAAGYLCVRFLRRALRRTESPRWLHVCHALAVLCAAAGVPCALWLT